MLAIATAMAVLSFSHCIPNRGALHRQDLLSVSLTQKALQHSNDVVTDLLHGIAAFEHE